MHSSSKIIPIFLASLGCVGILTFFLFSKASDAIALLQPMVSWTEVQEQAEDLLQKTELANLDLKTTSETLINKELHAYAQLRLASDRPVEFFPIASWQIKWEGEVETKKEGRQTASLTVAYDFDGHLVHFMQSSPNLRKTHSLKEEDALKTALAYLYDQGVDTSQINLSYKIINTDDRVLNYEFTFSRKSAIASDLVETYDVNIVGNRVDRYRAQVIFDSNEDFISPLYERSRRLSYLLVLIAWFMISVLALVRFFKKLRHDELEFKRGLQIGALVMVFAAIQVAVTQSGSWYSVLLASGAGGLLAGLAIMLVYAVSDSFVRELFPGKLSVLDVLWRGFFRVKEVGNSLLHALLLAGITLFWVALVSGIVSGLNLGYLEIDKMWVFPSLDRVVVNLLDRGTMAIFVSLLLLSFWPTYLQMRIKHTPLLFASMTLFLNFAGLHLGLIQPTVLAFALFLPLALIWAYAALRLEFLTLLVATFLAGFGLQLVLLPHIAGALSSLPTLVYGGIVLAVFSLGIVFINSHRSVADFTHYVPSYVSRIAERERLLKELEIARNVQMRFLPQAVPELPALDIGCLCKPAMEVGGDYYDFIQNGRNSLGVIIGDVSGKGVSAAFYMTMAKGIVKTLSRSNSEPKQILSEMNAIFYENVPKNVFISMMYGEFDLTQGLLRFARAGHNPLLIWRGNGTLETVLPKGLAIGLDGGGIFERTIEEIEIPFKTGDIFVFFTDGISEATNSSGHEFGETRLHEAICTHARLAAQDLVERIKTEVVTFADGASQHDDLTMVVVKIAD